MKHVRHVHFHAVEQLRIDELMERLGRQFTVELDDSRTGQQSFYDSFDWRLYRQKLLFFVDRDGLHLERFDGRPVAAAAGRKRPRYFWWDLAPSSLQTGLREQLEMRALRQVVSLTFRMDRYRVMNSDRKTIGVVTVRSDSAAAGATDADLDATISVDEIRGYEKAFEKILELCTGSGLTKARTKDRVARIFRASERVPLDYGDKFRVDLDPDITIGQAVSQLCLALVEDMETNHGGVCADIDSEFLHDFRIAVRRTRSLLSLLKKVLPKEQNKYFQAEFRWLGGVTGPVRDIDVYLLERDNYLALLPESLRDGMDLFFEQLRDGRGDELKLLRRHLNSARYHDLIDSWRTFLTAADSPLFAGSRTGSCRQYADSIIMKHFDGFLQDGAKIDGASPDRELHRLRIKGKKLRYLIEFFRSFYDESQANRFLKQMKQLQDNLGAFNDLSVQQEMLLDRLNGLRTRNLRTIRFAAALGGLIATLAARHRRVREEFEHTYRLFSTTTTKELLAAMIRGAGSDPVNRGKR